MLKFLGSLFRGKLTVIGTTLLAGGTAIAVAAPEARAAVGDVVAAVTASASTIAALVGTVVAAFGLGRKAARAADTPDAPVRPDA